MVFILLICETLIFRCCFSDVLLMHLWANLDERAMIWMQTKEVVFVFFLLISDYLIFHCCFIDGSLKGYWWTLENSLQTVLIRKKILCWFPIIDVSLLLHWIFVDIVDESLQIFWGDIDVFDANCTNKPSF